MGKFKEIGIGIGAFLILMIVLGMVISPQFEDTSDVSNEAEFIPDEIPKILTKPLDGLLPTIDELGLNWRLGEKEDPNKKLLEMVIPEDDVSTYQIESTGLIESTSQKYTKLETPSTWRFGATVSLYKFNSYDEAFQQWVNIIDFQNKNRAFDISGESDTCRSIQESRTWSDRHTDLCVKDNLLILVEYFTDRGIQFYDVQDDFVILRMIIKNMYN